jgi:hypothetical protein
VDWATSRSAGSVDRRPSGCRIHAAEQQSSPRPSRLLSLSRTSCLRPGGVKTVPRLGLQEGHLFGLAAPERPSKRWEEVGKHRRPLAGDRSTPHPANDLAIRDRCRYRVDPAGAVRPTTGRFALVHCHGWRRQLSGRRTLAIAQKEQPHDGAGRARSWCEPITAAGVVAAGVHSSAWAGSAGAAWWRLAMCFDSTVTLSRDTSSRRIDRPSSYSPPPSADAEV